ncbi:MAG: DUF2252 family protein [Gemmatimonadaceae bacterium]
MERIAAFNAGRNASRVARKYELMRADPFVFFRGTAHLFWEDWAAHASALDDVPLAWSCGDLHLENFGSFRGDNRLVYFDVNDFDDAALAPVTADVVRLLTSAHLAARSLRLTSRDAGALCSHFLDAYSASLLDGKAKWVERATSAGMVRGLLRKASERRQKDLLRSRTIVAKGKVRLRIDGQRTEKLSSKERAVVAEVVHEFAESARGLPHEPRCFRVLDVAARIAGTGSLGVRRYVVLTRGSDEPNGHFLLDIKEAEPSSLATNLTTAQPRWRNEAVRVVSIQHRMQAVSAALLASVTIGNRQFVLRELQPTEDRLALAQWNGKLSRLTRVLATMGHVTAWAQLRSASRQGSSGIDDLIAFGKGGVSRKVVLDYARDYAHEVEDNWREFAGGTTKIA